MHLHDPKTILHKLHIMKIGLSNGLLTKDEVIDWAYEIINQDDKPDIFFIDLALLSTKSKNEIIEHFSSYLNTELPVAQGRPLLGLLYKQYKTGRLDLDQTINTLYHLRFEADWPQGEDCFIIAIEEYYSLAVDNITGSIDEVRIKAENFLCLFKDYSFNNSEQWSELDKTVNLKFEKEDQRKSWWQFW